MGAVVLADAVWWVWWRLPKQQNATHNLLISIQVAKGFEQLGSSQMVVRLGGIYALEGVMNDKAAPQYHQPVLEALCTFVREGTIGRVTNGAPATDIRATLTVVGRRSNGPGSVNLAEAIAKADLVKADLTGAILSGASLSDANLAADLGGAQLTDANLTRRNLTRVRLSRANLTGASACNKLS